MYIRPESRDLPSTASSDPSPFLCRPLWSLLSFWQYDTVSSDPNIHWVWTEVWLLLGLYNVVYCTSTLHWSPPLTRSQSELNMVALAGWQTQLLTRPLLFRIYSLYVSTLFAFNIFCISNISISSSMWWILLPFSLMADFHNIMIFGSSGEITTHPKNISQFTHPLVISNLYDILSSAEHKRRRFEECW